jgi:hypothetical protein
MSERAIFALYLNLAAADAQPGKMDDTKIAGTVCGASFVTGADSRAGLVWVREGRG